MAVLRVSIIFTIGCFVLVTNSALSFLPFIGLKDGLPKGLIYVEGVLSVVSCGLFLIGSTIAFWESLKATRGEGGYFGWELEDYSPIATEEPQDSKAEEGECYEKKAEESLLFPAAPYLHRNNTHADLFKHFGDETLEDRPPSRPQSPPPSYAAATTTTNTAEHLSWKHVFSAHGFHEITCNLGLFASAVFLCSSLLYTMTAIASLVTILSSGEVFRAIRYPQLVAGSGFAIGSLLLLIKSQKDTNGHYWKPALRRLAWHVNLWNLIGSAGFVFCAYFGLLAHVHWSDFQFNCSYLWGSWAFLLGSMIQWYKARHKMAFVKRLDAKRAFVHKGNQNSCKVEGQDAELTPAPSV